MTGWLSVWSVSRMWRMSQEMAPSSYSPLPRQRCCWDVMFRRVILVTFAPCHAGELNLEQSSPDRDLQNLTRQQSPGLGEFFLTKKIQNTWVKLSCWVCCFTMAWCWNCDVSLGDWPLLRNNATNYKRICPEMLRECLIWDVLRCIGRSNASIARTKLSVTHNFDELLKLSQQQWH